NALTKNIQPYTGFKFHSIIGNTVDTTEPQLMSDGIVSYESAYLQGAVSSKVIKGGHSIQETPEAVLGLRRILRLHLSDLGLYDPESTIPLIYINHCMFTSSGLFFKIGNHAD